MGSCQPSTGRTLFVLLSVLILDLLAFTCILPLFPSIIDFYSKANTNHSSEEDVAFTHFESFTRYLQSTLQIPDLQRYNNVFFGGIIGSLFSFLQYLSSPLLGALSDVCGRKPILILSVCGSLLSYYVWYNATNFGLFILSRIVGGLSKASVSVAIAIVTDICPTTSRGKGMAYVGLCFSLAFIIGPAIGAYFASAAKELNLNNDGIARLDSSPAKFAMVITVLEMFLIAFLPETAPKSRKNMREVFNSAYSYVNPKSLFQFQMFDNTQQRAALQKYGKVYFFYLFIYSGLEFTLCFLTHIRFQYDNMQQGRLYLFTGFLMALLQGGFVRRIPLNRQHRAATIGLAIVVPAFLLISLAFNQSILYLSLALYAAASAIVVPCLTTLVSAQCDENSKGACMGVFRSIGALSRACGPIFGSLLFWAMGPSLAYAIGGCLLVYPVYLMRRIGHAITDERNGVKKE
ncbi:major facilitator superfamily domain-containing protein [Ditylenchus destructor]|uniref:Major facilitator superfamily domain-containing protein n=1 Tax=Ditylenchus destructor TaxID=166010 RepID=A0AAD4MVX2_9BILA|nr:major facilitator superfamily domain-containing protein [Ditylenchus destructor]